MANLYFSGIQCEDPEPIAIMKGIWFERREEGYTMRFLHYKGVTWLLKSEVQPTK